MNAPVSFAQRQRLKLRDLHGDDCWFCEEAIDFYAKPNSDRAPTKEHLQPKKLGGTGRLENLRLCHAKCNRELADLPLEEKEVLRSRRRANAVPTVLATARPEDENAEVIKSDTTDWRSIAWCAIAVACFFAGLASGLLLR